MGSPSTLTHLRALHTTGLPCPSCPAGIIRTQLPSSLSSYEAGGQESLEAAVSLGPRTVGCNTCAGRICIACGANVDGDRHDGCTGRAAYAIARGVECLRQCHLGIIVANARNAVKPPPVAPVATTVAAPLQALDAAVPPIPSPAAPPPVPEVKSDAAPAASQSHPPVEWTCNTCTFINVAGGAVCEVCDAPNPKAQVQPVPQSAAAPPAVPEPPLSPVVSPMPLPDVLCDLVSVPAPAAEPSMAPIADAAAPVAAAPPPAAAVEVTAVRWPWECALCTVINEDATQTSCSVCGTENPNPQPKLLKADTAKLTSTLSADLDSMLAAQLELGDDDASLSAMLSSTMKKPQVAKSPYSFASAGAPLGKPYKKPAVEAEVESDADDDTPPTAAPFAVLTTSHAPPMPISHADENDYPGSEEDEEQDYGDEEEEEEDYEETAAAAYGMAVPAIMSSGISSLPSLDAGLSMTAQLEALEAVSTEFTASLAAADMSFSPGAPLTSLAKKPGKLSGVGYAGSANDATAVAAAAARARSRGVRQDGMQAKALQLLTRVMRVIAELPAAGSGGDGQDVMTALVGPGFADGLAPCRITVPREGAPPPLAGDATSAAYYVSRVPKKHALSGTAAADGVAGPSILYRIASTYLRNSMIDVQSGTPELREAAFALLTCIQGIAAALPTLPMLAYTPSTNGSAASCTVDAGARTVMVPSASIMALLILLGAKAAAYNKASSHMTAAAMASSGDDATFLQMMGLASDIEDTQEKATRALIRWAVANHASTVTDTTDFKIIVDAATAAPAAAPASAAGGALVLDDAPAIEGAADPSGHSRSARSRHHRVANNMTPAERTAALRAVLGMKGDDVEAASGADVTPATPASAASAASSAAVADTAPGAVLTTSDVCALLSPSSAAAAAVSTEDASITDKYVTLMRSEAYTTVDSLAADHAYGGKAGSHRGEDDAPHYRGRGASAAPVGAMKRLMRVSAEMAGMADLAVNWASSILVRTDEASMDLLRAAIIGPVDTPYMNGAYMFDIKLPETYPNAPPKVQFLTTGSGDVRFNPNLYAEGKVCLSLLGTWSGPGWVPGESTLAQVLLSIQSQILVDVPYANEPSYERAVHTASGRRAVAMHNSQLRLANLRYAMLEALRSPPVGFEAAIRAHFFYKRAEIKAQCARWLQEAQALAEVEERYEARHAAALKAVQAAIELERELRYQYIDFVTESSVPSHSVFGWTAARRAMGGRGASTDFDLLACIGMTEVAFAKSIVPRPVPSAASASVDAAAAALKAVSSAVYNSFPPSVAVSVPGITPAMRTRLMTLHKMGGSTPPSPPIKGSLARACFMELLRTLHLSQLSRCLVDTVAMPEEAAAAAASTSGAAEAADAPSVAPAAASAAVEVPSASGFPMIIDANIMLQEGGMIVVAEMLRSTLKPYSGKSYRSLADAVRTSSPTHALARLINVRPGDAQDGYTLYSTLGGISGITAVMDLHTGTYLNLNGAAVPHPHAQSSSSPSAGIDIIAQAKTEVATTIAANRSGIGEVRFKDILLAMKATVLALSDALDTLREDEVLAACAASAGEL